MQCTQQSEFCNVSLKLGMRLVWSADLPGTRARRSALLSTAHGISLGARTHTASPVSPPQQRKCSKPQEIFIELCKMVLKPLYIKNKQKTSSVECYQAHLLVSHRAQCFAVAGWTGWWPSLRLAPSFYCYVSERSSFWWA